MYILFVLQLGCHNTWSSNDVTSSPRKFQAATVLLQNVKNRLFSYRKMNAEGVMNSVLLTSIRSEFLTWSRTKVSSKNENENCSHPATPSHPQQWKKELTGKDMVAYINNLEIFLVLLHEQLLIKLLDEVNLSISMQQLTEGFQRSSILDWQYRQWNMAICLLVYHEHDSRTDERE